MQTALAKNDNPKAVHGDYLASGFCFSLSSSILVGYPLGAAFGNSLGYWVIASAVLFAVSYGFTLLRKGPMLTELNFLVIAGFFLFAAAATAASSRGSGDWFAVLTLSAFTFGLPILVPVATLVWHARRCLAYSKPS